MKGVPAASGPGRRETHDAEQVRRLTEALAAAQADLAELADAQLKLIEAEETLRAIRQGEVDALVITTSPPGQQVFTLSSADRPYRIFVENMREGAATLSGTGTVLFANQRLGELLGRPASSLVAQPMADHVVAEDRPALLDALAEVRAGSTLELRLLGAAGRVVDALAGLAQLEVDGEPLTCLTFTDLTAEHALLREVQAREQQFEALYRDAPVPAQTWQDGPYGLVLIKENEAARRQLAGGLSGAPVAADVLYRDAPELLADLQACRTQRVVLEREVVRGSGVRQQHLQVTMVPVPPDLVVVHTLDVTERWVVERELRSSEERYRSIVENAQEGIAVLDVAGVFTFANRRTGELLGRGASSLVGLDAHSLLGPAAVLTSVADELGPAEREVSVSRPDGSTIALLVSTARVDDARADAGWLCMMSDVSGMRHAEEELAHWAMHDALTGLANRTLLMDRMELALTRSLRQPGSVAALFCDLDGFKEINDGFGHHVGDEVLRTVAARLTSVLRPSDTVARIGGDEFVVLCEGLIDDCAAFDLAARLLDVVALPAHAGGQDLSLSMSVGVAFNGTRDAGELLRNADAAMYLAKQRGRGRAELYDERVREVAADRSSVVSDLRHAVARDELRAHYQPIFALDGERLLGMEALVRWQHPRRGLMAPDDFIPLAEGANLIGELGAWVLRTACRQAARWGAAGPGGAPLHMAVNVSARQLARGGGLVPLVAEALAESGIDPATLILEVTESAVMDDAEATLGVLTDLKALGVRLAIDDFGTGYSSLVYLKRFPVDQLKVDRTFVRGLGTDADDSAIVASVVSLAHAVGIVAIAEGVETAEQLAALQGLGCGFGQGYLWSRPRPAAELEELLGLGLFGRSDAGPPAQRTAPAAVSRLTDGC